MAIVNLTKHSRNSIQAVSLERDGHLIRKKEGKLGKPAVFSSTSNCGSFEDALKEMDKLVEKYKEAGFSVWEGPMDLYQPSHI